MSAHEKDSANASVRSTIDQAVGPRGASDSFQAMAVMLKRLEESQWNIARKASSPIAARRHEELALGIAAALEIAKRLKTTSPSSARR